MELGGEKTNILASGGIKGEIRMFHPSAKVGFSIISELCKEFDVFGDKNLMNKRSSKAKSIKKVFTGYQDFNIEIFCFIK